MTADANHLGTLLEAAQFFGWMRHHQRPGFTRQGYRTAITGDVGFPDLVLARRSEILHFEVKSADGYPSKDAKTGAYPQLVWLANLPHAYLVRPAALDEALALITGQALPHEVTCTLTISFDPVTGARWAGPLAAWADKRYRITPPRKTEPK